MSKAASYPAYQNSIIRKKFTVPFFKYKRLKLKLRLFLVGHIVAMVTYCVTKIILTCSPMIGQFFDTMIMTHQNLPLGKCWKLFWATLSVPFMLRFIPISIALRSRPRLFESWIMLSTRKITIQQINVNINKLHWIAIYPVYSIIQFSNNQGLEWNSTPSLDRMLEHCCVDSKCWTHLYSFIHLAPVD